MFRLFLSTMIFCITFISFNSAKGTVDFKTDLIQKFTYGKAVKNSPELPFLAIHQKDKKTLFFLATKHGGKSINADTFTFLDSIFEKYKFGTVFIEGVKYEEKNNEKYEKQVAECAQTNFENCGESEYTYSKAMEKNIPVFGAEPFVSEQNSELITAGFSKEDLYMFYTFRHIYLEKQTKKISTEDQLFTRLVKKQTEDSFRGRSVGLNKTYSLDEIKAYYKKNLGKDLAFDSFSHKDDDPDQSSDIIFQKIAGTLLTILDKNVLKHIQEKFQKTNSILLVIGGAHYGAYDPIFQDTMPRKTFVEFNQKQKTKSKKGTKKFLDKKGKMTKNLQ